MKKYLLLAFLTVSGLAGLAQTTRPIHERTRSSNTNTEQDAYFRASLSMYIPMGTTPVDSAHLGLAAIFYKVDPVTHVTSFWILNPITHVFEQWAKSADLITSTTGAIHYADSLKAIAIAKTDSLNTALHTLAQTLSALNISGSTNLQDVIINAAFETRGNVTFKSLPSGNQVQSSGYGVTAVSGTSGKYVTMQSSDGSLRFYNGAHTGIIKGDLVNAENEYQLPANPGTLVTTDQLPGGGIGGHDASKVDSAKLYGTVLPTYSKKDTALNLNKNLYELANKGTARTNLAVYSKTEADAKVLTKADSAKLYGVILPTYALKDSTLKPNKNLSDVASKTTALANLGALAKTGNLSDVSNATTARQNLGVRLSYRFNAASTTYTSTVNTHAIQVKFSPSYLATSPILNKWVLFMGYYGHTQLSLPPNHLCDSLLARGYSVVTINVGNSWGNLAAQQLYQQLIKFCLENFNFEYQPYVIAESMGTLAALNMINNGTLQARSLVALTPVVNLYGYYTLAIGQASGTSIQTAYNFPQSLDSCKKAIYGYDPYQWVKNNFGDSVYNANNIPTYFLQGNLDPYVGWTRTMVKAAISAGRNQYLSEMNGYGHDTSGITAVRINAIANWMAAPTRLTRVIPGKQTAKIDSTFTPMQGITDPTQTATQLTYKNSAGLLASVPIYYDAVNRRYGFGSAATTYKYEFNTSDQSNRFAFNATSTLAFANNAFYWFLNTSPANYGMDMQFYKNTAGAGVGTSEFIMRSSALRGTGKPYTYFQMHMDSILTSSLNLSAPNKLILSVGWDNATGTSTGIPFLNAYGASGAAFTGAVFGSGANSLNGSGIPFQWKAHIAPYTDATYNNGDAAYRWLNVFSVNNNTRHIVGGSATPTIAAGAGAGTSPTVSISGTDLSGTITVTTGTSPTANTTIATVTFNGAYATAPRVAGNPAAKNTTTATLSATSPPFYTTTTTTLVIMGNSVALAPSTTYVWDYTLSQ